MNKGTLSEKTGRIIIGISLLVYVSSIILMGFASTLTYTTLSMSITIITTAIAPLLSTLGIYLIEKTRSALFSYGIPLLLLSGVAVTGCAIELDDRLCECGYSAFGSVFIIWAGMCAVPIGFIVVFVIWVRTLLKAHKDSKTHSSLTSPADS